MKIQYDKSLKSYNTFGIDISASRFIKVTSENELIEVLQKNKNQKLFILSGGSNMLLTKDIEALVIHIAIKGIETSNSSENKVFVAANAGENWHEFVQYCIDNNYGGLENLSLIPGYVGSAPIQNIGAYGVELKDSFDHCEAIHIKTGKKRIFKHQDCNFGYRNSIFKTNVKGEYIITKVVFKLTTKNHQLHTSYGAILQALENKKISSPTIKNISDAVISIRESKLPDPKKIGNSGSFFKNPVVSNQQFIELKEQFPNIPHYSIDDKSVKIPAGWLIEQSGFKGKRWGDAGVHAKQALVLVNYGKATGAEILAISKQIRETILAKFSILLETEVNIF